MELKGEGRQDRVGVRVTCNDQAAKRGLDPRLPADLIKDLIHELVEILRSPFPLKVTAVAPDPMNDWHGKGNPAAAAVELHIELEV
jgi:hypothetical protein